MKMLSILNKLHILKPDSENFDLKSAKIKRAIFDNKLQPNIKNINKYEHSDFDFEQWIQNSVFLYLDLYFKRFPKYSKIF